MFLLKYVTLSWGLICAMVSLIHLLCNPVQSYSSLSPLKSVDCIKLQCYCLILNVYNIQVLPILAGCQCIKEFSCYSTIFLMGPMRQLKRMFEPTRLIATIVMLVSRKVNF